MAIIYILSIVFLFAFGCSTPTSTHNQTSKNSPTTNQTQIQNNILNLPSPEEISSRITNSNIVGSLDGSKFDVTTIPPEFVTASGSLAKFKPNWNAGGSKDFAYALYAFNQHYQYGSRLLKFNWDTPPEDGNYYVALGNVKYNTWIWNSFKASEFYVIDNISHFVTSNDYFLVLVALTGNKESSLKSITLNGTPPTAQLTSNPDPCVGSSITKVTFDASTSTSINGKIEDYLWDLDGDGIFNEANNSEISYKGKTEAEMTASADNIFNVKVKIIDETGLCDTASISVGNYKDLGSGLVLNEVNKEDLFYELKGNIIDGEVFFIAPVNDEGFTYSRILVVKTTDKQSKWGTQVEVANISKGVLAFDSAFVNGFPCFAYVTTSSADGLVFYSAKDKDGLTWNDPVKVISPCFAEPIDIIDLNGVPAVTCIALDAGKNSRCFISAKDAAGKEWNSLVNISAATDPPPPMGSCSMNIVNGNPAMVYRVYDSSTETYSLLYTRASDASGTTWSKPSSIISLKIPDSSTELGINISLLSSSIYGPSLTYTQGSYLLETLDSWMIDAQDNNGDTWFAPKLLDEYLDFPQRTMSSVRNLSLEKPANTEEVVSDSIEDPNSFGRNTQVWGQASLVNAGGQFKLMAQTIHKNQGPSSKFFPSYHLNLGEVKIEGNSPKILRVVIEAIPNSAQCTIYYNVRVMVSTKNNQGKNVVRIYSFLYDSSRSENNEVTSIDVNL